MANDVLMNFNEFTTATNMRAGLIYERRKKSPACARALLGLVDRFFTRFYWTFTAALRIPRACTARAE